MYPPDPSTHRCNTASCSITVSESPKSVSFENSSIKVSVGEKAQVTAVLSNGMSNVTYKSSDPNVCKVNSVTGELKAKSKGGAVITASTHNGKTAYCEVTVK